MNASIRSRSVVLRCLASVSFCFLAALRASAQWQEQSVVLRPGWNAVHLDVVPSTPDLDAALNGVAVESVWDWNPTASSPQFIQDPSKLVPGSPGWLTWFPRGHPLAPQSSLFALREGRCYLIRLADSARVTTWNVTGAPSVRGTTWRPNSLNFVGFRIGSDNAPSFAQLFSGDASLEGQPIYQLGPDGAWVRIAEPSGVAPSSGEAYWVRSASASTRSGTIALDAIGRDGLRFGDSNVEAVLRVRNTSAAPRRVTLRLVPSTTPPPGMPPSAGPVPLEYYEADYTRSSFEWRRLQGAFNSPELEPGVEWNVRLGIRRATASAGPAPAPGSEYQSLLEVADDLGTRWLVPVSAVPQGQRLASSPAIHGSSSNPAGDSPSPLAGLWVGDVTINAVSQPARLADGDLPRPAGSDFTFRVLMHSDRGGTARLLRHAFVVRKPPTTKPDPENPGFNRVDQPARTLVVTDEALLPRLVDSQALVGRRVSTAAFAVEGPFMLSGTGSFGFRGISGLSGSLGPTSSTIDRSPRRPGAAPSPRPRTDDTPTSLKRGL